MKTLKLTLVLCLISSLAFCGVSDKEKDALLAIYNSTQGENWNTTWDLNQSVHTWYGVEVRDNKVVGIEIPFNNLRGQLPEAVGDLVHLETLNLFRNNISGVLPNTIGNLTSLKVLNIAFNNISYN